MMEAKKILESAAHKLPMKTKFVDKGNVVVAQVASVS